MLFSNKWSFGAAKRMWSFKKINQILNSNIEERKQTSHSSRICKGFVAQISLGNSYCESRVIAECHEELDTNDLQDQELVELWPFSEATRLPFDLVWRRDGLKTGSLKRAVEKWTWLNQRWRSSRKYANKSWGGTAEPAQIGHHTDASWIKTVALCQGDDWAVAPIPK